MKKSRNKKERYIRICPKCGSINIQTDYSNPAVWAYGTSTKYKCNSCGVIGPVFPEILESEITEYKKGLEKEIKYGKIKSTKEDLIDASSGFFAVRIELVIVLGILIIILFGAGNYLYNNETVIFTILVSSIIFLIALIIKSYNEKL